MKKVEVYVRVCGDYCAFHEMSIRVVYDITNNINFDDLDLEELEDWEYDSNYCDYSLCDAILDDGKYYSRDC